MNYQEPHISRILIELVMFKKFKDSLITDLKISIDILKIN